MMKATMLTTGIATAQLATAYMLKRTATATADTAHLATVATAEVAMLTTIASIAPPVKADLAHLATAATADSLKRIAAPMEPPAMAVAATAA